MNSNKIDNCIEHCINAPPDIEQSLRRKYEELNSVVMRSFQTTIVATSHYEANHGIFAIDSLMCPTKHKNLKLVFTTTARNNTSMQPKKQTNTKRQIPGTSQTFDQNTQWVCDMLWVVKEQESKVDSTRRNENEKSGSCVPLACSMSLSCEN